MSYAQSTSTVISGREYKEEELQKRNGTIIIIITIIITIIIIITTIIITIITITGYFTANLLLFISLKQVNYIKYVMQ